MSRSSFPGAVHLVLALEGGFVDDRRDPGGATNFGITRRTLAAARGGAASVADVKALSRDEAVAIYRRLYWDAVRGDSLSAGLDLATFDIAVHSGPGQAVRLLQRAVGAAVDGAPGPSTLAAAAQAAPEQAIRALTRARLAMLAGLPASRTFGRGWRRRVLAVEAEALRLARAADRADIAIPNLKDNMH